MGNSLPICSGSPATEATDNNITMIIESWDNCKGRAIIDGHEYLGEWKDGSPNGYGEYNWSTGEIYIGEIKDFAYHGQGSYTDIEGNQYVGEFYNDEKNGKGIFIFNDGSRYTGEFRNDSINGYGTLIWPNGDRYIGQFKDGLRNGLGTYTFLDGELYAGQYKDDVPHGHGIYAFPDGERYIGDFNNNMMHGQGTYVYPSGEKYVGEWSEDLEHGQGTLTYTDGRQLSGLWLYGEFKGDSSATNSDDIYGSEQTSDKIIPINKGPNNLTYLGSGSSFQINSEGYIITNEHVVNGCQYIEVKNRYINTEAKVIAKDPQHDLALVLMNESGDLYYNLSGEPARILDEITVAGYPYGDDLSSSVKVTKGIVSSITGISDNYSDFQIDAAVQPGNSGGPVINNFGNVVGVAAAKLDYNFTLQEYGDPAENINFGVKSSILINFLDSNQIDFNITNDNLNSKQLRKLINQATYYIDCYGNE
tara:strand:- start:2337 stop:3764 length:1428 start_codon:yes stop_codon:yes gene_type:complete